MKMGLEFWAEHVAAAKLEGMSLSAYAKQHGFTAKRFYYWQRKLSAAAAHPVGTISAKSFIAVRVAEPVISQRLVGCTLVLESGMRLEMSGLPAPEWLAALGRAARGAR
jgi:transposase-like protein